MTFYIDVGLIYIIIKNPRKPSTGTHILNKLINNLLTAPSKCLQTSIKRGCNTLSFQRHSEEALRSVQSANQQLSHAEVLVITSLRPVPFHIAVYQHGEKLTHFYFTLSCRPVAMKREQHVLLIFCQCTLGL